MAFSDATKTLYHEKASAYQTVQLLIAEMNTISGAATKAAIAAVDVAEVAADIRDGFPEIEEFFALPDGTVWSESMTRVVSNFNPDVTYRVTGETQSSTKTLSELLDVYDLVINGNVVSLESDGSVDLSKWLSCIKTGDVQADGYIHVEAIGGFDVDQASQMVSNFFPTEYFKIGNTSKNVSDVLSDLGEVAQGASVSAMAMSMLGKESPTLSDFTAAVTNTYPTLTTSARNIISRLSAVNLSSGFPAAVADLCSTAVAEAEGIDTQNQSGAVLTVPPGTIFSVSSPINAIVKSSMSQILVQGAAYVAAGIVSVFQPAIGVAMAVITGGLSAYNKAVDVQYFKPNAVRDSNNLYGVMYETDVPLGYIDNTGMLTITDGRFGYWREVRGEYLRTVAEMVLNQGYFITDTGGVILILSANKQDIDDEGHVVVRNYLVVRPAYDKFTTVQDFQWGDASGWSLARFNTGGIVRYRAVDTLCPGPVVWDQKYSSPLDEASGIYSLVRQAMRVGLAFYNNVNVGEHLDYEDLSYQGQIDLVLSDDFEEPEHFRDTPIAILSEGSYIMSQLARAAGLARGDFGVTSDAEFLRVLTEYGHKISDAELRPIWDRVNKLMKLVNYLMCDYAITQWSYGEGPSSDPKSEREKVMIEELSNYGVTAGWGSMIYTPIQGIHFDFLAPSFTDVALSIITRFATIVTTAVLAAAVTGLVLTKLTKFRVAIGKANARINHANTNPSDWDNPNLRRDLLKSTLIVGLSSAIKGLFGIAFLPVSGPISLLSQVETPAWGSNAANIPYDAPLGNLSSDEKLNLIVTLIRG